MAIFPVLETRLSAEPRYVCAYDADESQQSFFCDVVRDAFYHVQILLPAYRDADVCGYENDVRIRPVQKRRPRVGHHGMWPRSK
jgi:hypothetical protein